MNKERRNFLMKMSLGAGLLGIPGSRIFADSREVSDAINEKIVGLTPSGEADLSFRVDPIEQVRVGFIGVGNRGTSHVQHYAAMFPEKSRVVAVCDIREKNAEKAAKICKKEGQDVAVYAGKSDSWKEMLKRDDLDLVVIATPWEWHAPMAIEAMENGIHVVSEVPLATTIEDLNKVVSTSEKTGRHCMLMENVNYGNEELWVLNMVRNQIFGTVTYGAGAYIHNLLEPYLFGEAYYNQWRIRHHLTTDGNLYPTHGLGPIAWYMDINRGDKFEFMVSMSSLQASLSEHSKEVDASNEFYNRDDFKHGDMNSSLIKTAMGKSILMQHDVVTHRPYSRINALGGTGAYHEGYPSRLAMKGKGHSWLNNAEYNDMRKKYDHPIWSDLKEEIKKHGGHGGMDFVMNYRILDCLNKGLPLDINVYDSAAWSAVFPISVLSVELGSIPVKFPDWTRGKWKEKRELGI